MFGKEGLNKIGAGVSAQVRIDAERNLVANLATGKYYEAVKAGRVFVASNQAAVALTAAMATTYTGLVLFNPAASNKDLVLLGAGYATTVAVPTATVIGLMAAAVVTNATMDAAAAVTPQNRLIGCGNASVAIVDNGCTLNGTPVLHQVFGHAWTEATTAGSVGSNNWADLDGSIIVQPNSYVAFYSFAANTAAFILSFMWEEVPR